MNLPEDLKHYKADDSFQLIRSDLAAFLLYLGAVILLILTNGGIT